MRDALAGNGACGLPCRVGNSRTWKKGAWTLSLNLEDKKAVVAEIAKQVGTAQAIVMAREQGLGRQS